MKKVDKILDAVMRCLMAIAMFALLAGGTWQIFTRWILKNPSTFTDEFLRYVLIWASMIGSAYCFYKDEHLALDLVKDRLHGKAKKSDCDWKCPACGEIYRTIRMLKQLPND